MCTLELGYVESKADGYDCGLKIDQQFGKYFSTEVIFTTCNLSKYSFKTAIESFLHNLFFFYTLFFFFLVSLSLFTYKAIVKIFSLALMWPHQTRKDMEWSGTVFILCMMYLSPEKLMGPVRQCTAPSHGWFESGIFFKILYYIKKMEN